MAESITNTAKLTVNQAVKAVKKKSLWYRIWYYRYMYLFLLPAILWYFIFKYIPIYGITLGFKEYQFDKGIFGSPWVGLRYWNQFIHYYDFWVLIGNTLRLSTLKMLFNFPAPIILALMINEVKNTGFKRTIQTVSYLPHFVSWVVVAALFTKLLSPNDGLVNELLVKCFHMEPIPFMFKTENFDWIIVFSQMWKEIGWGSIIYLAAISGIDPGLYEAATIDGANKFKSILHITLPCLMPTMCIVFLLNVGNLIRAGFDQIYLFQTPSVVQISEVLDTYVVKMGIQQGQFSYATIVGLFQSIVALLLILVSNRISKKLSETSLW